MATAAVWLADHDSDIDELTDVTLEEVVWAERAHMSARFSLPTAGAEAAQIQGIAHEAKVVVDGTDVVFWGPIVRWDADDRRATFGARDPLWFFEKRYVGKADRTNLLANPGFEDGLTSWTAVGTTATVVTSPKRVGAQAVELVQATPLGDAYLSQQFAHTAGGQGDVIVFAAHFYIDAWTGPALRTRGLYAARIATGNIVQDVTVWPMDFQTPRDSWQRAELPIGGVAHTVLWVPPGEIETIEVRLYSPAGTIVWDEISATLMESISLGETDIGDMGEALVTHGQDAAVLKSDVNVTAALPTTGIVLSRYYQHAEHANISHALMEFADMDPGLEYEWAFTATDRTLGGGSPTIGTNVGPAITFELGAYGLKVEGGSFDADQACSSATILGPGDGPDREEGGYVDSALFGATTVESVRGGPEDADIDSLDALAQGDVTAGSKPTEYRLSTTDELLLDVHVGDTVPCDIAWGLITLSGDYRVVGKRWVPATHRIYWGLNET